MTEQAGLEPDARRKPDQGVGGHTESRPAPMLSPAHERMLVQESGIAPEIVQQRGYRTVTVQAELRRLGFGLTQSSTPALLIPLYGPTGDIAGYQARPDQPRNLDGRSLKYEMPSGARMVLDVHPAARSLLGDPSVPLFITEGTKKGDALVSRGVCAVALLGVWGWRGRNNADGLTALPEWESIALKGRHGPRDVYIVFDSDVMTKLEVYQALRRLKVFLERRGA
jgi:hypothetical protein